MTIKTQVKINRRKMSQDECYLYSQARASRILGVKPSEIEFVYVCGDGRILVGLYNDSVYLSDREFKIAYGEERKARAKELIVTKRLDMKSGYTVRNESSKSAYKVKAFIDGLVCECPDYEISSQVMNSDKVACKHIYAVLGQLGYSSLREYIKGQKADKQAS
jgi:hypothetical protein